MRLGVTALALLAVLIAVSIGIGVLAFGEQLQRVLETFARLAR